MLSILLLFASLSWGQELSTSTANILKDIQFRNLSQEVRELRLGQPTITAAPTYISTITTSGAGLTITNGALTLTNSGIIISTTAGTVGITFQDGTTQSTAFSSLASSRTAIPENSTAISQATLIASVANSTVTINSIRTSRHQLIVSAVMRISDSGASANCGIMKDGQWIDGQTAAIGIWSGQAAAAGHHLQFDKTWNTSSSYAAGTHKYSIACSVSAGNVQFCADSAAYNTSCFFEVRELPY